MISYFVTGDWVGEDCCQWKGISCASSSSLVTKIDISFARGEALEAWYPNATLFAQFNTWNCLIWRGIRLVDGLCQKEEEILLLLFYENIERYRRMFSEGGGYYINNVVVKPNTQCCPITNHQYHLRPMRFTTVLPFDGDTMPISWKFPSLKNLCQTTSSTTDLCDILGILVSVSKIQTIKTHNNFTFKKELVLIDDSNHPVILTLWALKAHSVTEDMVHLRIFHTVLMVKAVNVVQYQGGSLSSTGYTTITVNPINVGAERLVAWLEGNASARSLLMRIQSSSSPSIVTSVLPLDKRVNIIEFYQHMQRDALMEAWI
ncbi:replication protein A 70 kDa DNA-binding subunit B-like isoform X2 [Tasmannia lanceolata]|uniref:replication protein A 70 kDa DNA-binding subunit B-like isoform X2 n=1 Tax=Tasmannia lanceolata TaxID=3420 RepID=UPI004064622B